MYPTADRGLTVNELLVAYWTHAETYYLGPDGRPAESLSNLRYTLRAVKKLFGSTRAADFGPKSLKALRDAWVNDGDSRKMVNGRTGAVKRVFRWAVGEELVGPDVFQRLACVEGLRAGRPTAHDNPADPQGDVAG